MGLTVRPLPPEELPRLLSLHDYADPAAMVAQNGAHLRSGDREFFVLELDGELIGELRVKHRDPDPRFAAPGVRAYLYAFRVKADHRGRGYGTHLAQQVLALLAGRGCREVTVGVEDDNPQARALYTRLGFTEFVARCSETYQGDSYEFDLLLHRI